MNGLGLAPLILTQCGEDITFQFGSFSMLVKKVSTGQMWKSEETGEIFMVTSLYKEVLASYALLRMVGQAGSEKKKRAKVVRTESGEGISGFSIADLV